MNNLTVVENIKDRKSMDGLVEFFKLDFEKHIGNLWKTRAGLYHIYLTRPDLKESLLPQLETLNGTIAALLEYQEYHPSINDQNLT